MYLTLHQRTRSLASLAAAAFLLAGCAPDSTAPLPDERPSLVTYGTPSGTAHPEVVLILMEANGVPNSRCSGTLISPTIVLTAGHCTGEPGEFSGMRIYTESNVQTGDNSYPFAGNNSVEATAWHTHPEYTSAAFYLHDVGVIELASPVILPAGSYGVLPGVNVLDALRRGSRTTFTAVGYGLQRINPVFIESRRIRMQAEPHLIQINTGFTGPQSLLLSNNASTGGTCFGDSGGPNYIGTSNVVGGVTSFGINGNCAGTGGVFRMDRADVLAFVQPFLD
ncbi:MAG TPA: trypsin-like serine protease [Gemmatimonadaceae bacterium]|nr:trypsin-like serine protease [Gemmatimonadaceae bacterium]